MTVWGYWPVQAGPGPSAAKAPDAGSSDCRGGPFVGGGGSRWQLSSRHVQDLVVGHARHPQVWVCPFTQGPGRLPIRAGSGAERRQIRLPRTSSGEPVQLLFEAVATPGWEVEPFCVAGDRAFPAEQGRSWPAEQTPLGRPCWQGLPAARGLPCPQCPSQSSSRAVAGLGGREKTVMRGHCIDPVAAGDRALGDTPPWRPGNAARCRADGGLLRESLAVVRNL